MMSGRENHSIAQLRLSVTDRCDMRCAYCLPLGNARPVHRAGVLDFEEIVAIVERMKQRFGLRAVRLTGGEPLLRRRLPELVGMLASLGLEDLAMTTNGQALQRFAKPLVEAGLRRVNVSLDTLDPERFRRMNGGDLERVWHGIDAALERGLSPVKLNVVVLQRYNDDELLDLVDFAATRCLEIRFLELMALGEAASRFRDRMVPSAVVRSRLIAAGISLKQAPTRRGAPARRWMARLPDGRQVAIGFVSSETSPFCQDCGRLRLTARGMLLGCLKHESGPDLRAILRAPGGYDEVAFDDAIRRAIRLKTAGRPSLVHRSMSAVGG